VDVDGAGLTSGSRQLRGGRVPCFTASLAYTSDSNARKGKIQISRKLEYRIRAEGGPDLASPRLHIALILSFSGGDRGRSLGVFTIRYSLGSLRGCSLHSFFTDFFVATFLAVDFTTAFAQRAFQ
jgi:hypothetical protein